MVIPIAKLGDDLVALRRFKYRGNVSAEVSFQLIELGAVETGFVGKLFPDDCEPVLDNRSAQMERTNQENELQIAVLACRGLREQSAGASNLLTVYPRNLW